VKALIFGLCWVGVGAALASRRRPGEGPAELALAVLFWPLFLAQGGGGPAPADPMDRLRRALGPGDAAAGLLGELEEALRRLAARQARVEAALRELRGAGEGPGTEVRRASEAMLRGALERVRAERHAALAAVEEAATRLLLAGEDGDRGEVEHLLQALRARLVAGEEVEAGARPPAPPPRRAAAPV
jgi:hypothetical protein